MSLFFTNFSKDLNLFIKLYNNSNLNIVIVIVKQLKNIYNSYIDSIRIVQTRTVEYLQDKQKIAP